ncbi:MAG TPA: TlpA disulfide reductase family protein [Burkholderiales bacterium]|nr:TlpA disulfide reductase family protein [Burkholderiales bacterium]
MSRTWQAVLFATVAAAALAAGFLLHPWSREEPAVQPPASAQSLMLAALPDLAGQSQPLSQWKGKVLVVNFWATWCAPCREEIPALIQAQNRLGPRGLQIIGIAIDQVERVKPYADEMRINYPVLVGELDAMDLAQQAGNQLGGLPFTVVLDRSGKPIRSELGALNQDKLERIVQPLL